MMTWNNSGVPARSLVPSGPGVPCGAAVAPGTARVSVTVVHLLRHGKVHNPTEVLYGRLPGFRLAASGQAMAAGIAAHVAPWDITYLAASSLQRAQETAAPLARTLGLDVVTDDRVIEAANAFEGVRVPFDGAWLTRPATWVQLRNPARPSWGEPYLDIAHRMLAAVYAALAAADGHQAVLVSHQLPIVTVRRFLQGQRLWHDPRRRRCSVASLTSLSFTDGSYTGYRYSEPVAGIAPVNDPDLAMIGTPVASTPDVAS